MWLELREEGESGVEVNMGQITRTACLHYKADFDYKRSKRPPGRVLKQKIHVISN